MSKYNLDTPKKNYFQNVNINSLPELISIEFIKIYESYHLFCLVHDGEDDVYIATNENSFDKLKQLQIKNELYTTISNNLIFDEQSTIEHGFEELKDKNLVYYKFKNIDYFDWFVTRTYSEAFVFGYNYEFDSDYEIFSTVYKKHNGTLNDVDDLFNENYSFPVLDQHYFTIYGEEEGMFIKAWQEILKRPQDFENIACELQNQIDVLNSNIKFNITQTELIELTKALIESGTVIGKQKDIINSFTQFFNVEINNPNKLITDIKKRNIGSETLFIDKLKSTLYNYITKENKR